MPYEVRTPVYEGPFDLLLHLILKRGGRALGGLAVGDRRRVPRRARADEHRADARPRRRHRVPAHRRDARRAQGPPPPARPRRRSSSTRSCCASRSATCCSPACSSARRSRTPPPRSKRASAAPQRSVPRTAGPEEPYRSLAPDPLERVRPEAAARGCAARVRRGRRRSSSTPTTSPRCAPACATRSRPCCGCCPTSEPMSFRALVAGVPDTARGHRALPRGARALQAGRRRPRAVHELRRAARAPPPPGRGRARRRQPRRLERRARADRVRTGSTRRRAPSTETVERGRSPQREPRPRASDARAIEAVVLAATEPVEPRLLAQLVELPAVAGRGALRRARAASTRSRARVRARAGRRRLPLPDPSRPRAVRRAVRARRPATRGCRRPRSRRWRSSPTSSRSRAGRSRRSAA